MADEIKIRTLPRSNEEAAPRVPADTTPGGGNLMAALGIVSLMLAFFALGTVWWMQSRGEFGKTQRSLAATQEVDPVSASINRHMYNAHLQEEMIKRRLLIENQQSRANRDAEGAFVLPDISTTYGVQMDHEKSLERVYQDLHANDPTVRGVNLEDKVNAMLANRKWLNELEKAERITFVRNFIRAAFDRGWEVQLDDNLVVTGVRPITQPKQVNIEQVLERIAKKEKGY